MRFALIDGAKAEFPVHRLCRVLGVSQSGYFAWRGRLACRRQRDDMVLLAHVRSAFSLSNSTAAVPAHAGTVDSGSRPVAADRPASRCATTACGLGRSGGSRTTDGPSRLASRAEPARSTSRQRARQEVGRRHLLRGPAKAGCISPLLSTCSHAGSSAGQQATGCIGTWLSSLCAKPWTTAVRHHG